MNTVTVPANYKPSEKEAYMNPVMLEYFRRRLLQWKTDIVKEADELLHELQHEGGLQEPDIADRASVETEVALELRARDRQRKLISKIDEALERIERGEYGYCEETGEPIGVRRLEARPVATLSVEAQERHERKERTQRDERE
jgi:DnaK suppressor protein